MRITPPWRNILSYDAQVLGIFLRKTLQKSSSWYFHPTDGKLTSQNSVQNPFKMCDNHLARIKQRLCCEYGPITFAGSIGKKVLQKKTVLFDFRIPVTMKRIPSVRSHFRKLRCFMKTINSSNRWIRDVKSRFPTTVSLSFTLLPLNFRWSWNFSATRGPWVPIVRSDSFRTPLHVSGFNPRVKWACPLSRGKRVRGLTIFERCHFYV